MGEVKRSWRLHNNDLIHYELLTSLIEHLDFLTTMYEEQWHYFRLHMRCLMLATLYVDIYQCKVVSRMGVKARVHDFIV